MAQLLNTKTHENLKQAFAGESQANRRYLWFAQKADVEGLPEIALLFKNVADRSPEKPMSTPRCTQGLPRSLARKVLPK